MKKPFLLSTILFSVLLSSAGLYSSVSPAVPRSTAFPADPPSSASPAVLPEPAVVSPSLSAATSPADPRSAAFPAVPPEPAGLTVMFWNLENFFDYFDGGTSESDTEFSSRGGRHWTKKRFLAKCNAIAKTVLWLGSPAQSVGPDSSGSRYSASTTGAGPSAVFSGSRYSASATGAGPSAVSSGSPSSVSTTGAATDGLPDIVAFAEVENRFVLRRLISETALKKLDYQIVHYDSPDPRGIDCALLFRSSRLRLLSSKPCHVGLSGSFTPFRSLLDLSTAIASASIVAASTPPDTLKTRDILLAQFLTPAGDSLAVLVNHHPSKYGGGETDWRREVAIERLRELSDSIAAEGWHQQIALGDFNDTPDNPLFSRLSPALTLCRYGNPSLPSSLPSAAASSDRPSASSSAGTGRPSLSSAVSSSASFSSDRPSASSGPLIPRGSIRFNGEWQLIDLCFASPAIASRCSFRAVMIPFLTERDAAHSGDKPLRTYSGPRYLGGVSDHLPILVHLEKSAG